MIILILSTSKSNAFNQNNHSTAHIIYNYFWGEVEKNNNKFKKNPTKIKQTATR
jgi:hypothetical protein